jgi:hypothetical protein
MKLKESITDKRGRVTIGERPNLPLIVWAVTSILVWIVPSGTLEDLLRLINFGALFTWAWLEVFQGSSYFRRVLGAIIMIFLLWNRVHNSSM